jgi:hypothetical protein
LLATAIGAETRRRSTGLLRANLRVGDSWRDDTLYALLETDRRGQS